MIFFCTREETEIYTCLPSTTSGINATDIAILGRIIRIVVGRRVAATRKQAVHVRHGWELKSQKKMSEFIGIRMRENDKDPRV
jgi:hypothetical protein